MCFSGKQLAVCEALERVSHRGDSVSRAYSLILAHNHAASVLEKVIKDMAGD